MSDMFELIIEADHPNRRADLRLCDGHGTQLSYRQTDFHDLAASMRQGLFNLRAYLQNYVEATQQAASVAEIGVCIAEQVLGEEIFGKLWASRAQRTLRIRLPGATMEPNPLAAALARVPWEIARPAVEQKTLAERNLLVRVVHGMATPDTEPLALKPEESLRVLFVFAEARGSLPLMARRERHELQQLLARKVYPDRRIEADFLTHGVTRARLVEQIQDRNGYHIVHWSGHGHLNALELAKPGGSRELLSGDDLLDLFVDAGGFIPRLFFLSACYSGDILQVRDWHDFLAVAQGQQPGAKQTPAPTKEILLPEDPGYTGTAHALLRGGVASVVAMRYAVGDDYARTLAVEFYDALLAQSEPKSVAAALTMARNALRAPEHPAQARFAVCDHATPLLYGAEESGLTLPAGRSPALDTRNPRRHPIAELTIREHPQFVGRTWELDALGAEFIGASSGAETQPVAVINGLGGMGKTALAAEVLALWENRFRWVLLYQAKPNALAFEGMLRDIHLKLSEELDRYYRHVQSHPADAVFRDASDTFTGAARQQRLTSNLIRAMRDEAILLVLDNFERNLKPSPEPTGTAGEPGWACQDPAWERAIQRLATELVGARSRVLITSRHPLAALSGTVYTRVTLGPLPATEAALYLREHAGLSGMAFGGDAGEKALAERLVRASRFHPLLMDRLARLATAEEDALRLQLLQALDALEQRRDHDQLPGLFATGVKGALDAVEVAYLDDALALSLDLLLKEAGADARRLLWVIALANEPVALDLLTDVWNGESPWQEMLRRTKSLLEKLAMLPPEQQERLQPLPPEVRAEIDTLSPVALEHSHPAPLLHRLVAVGLATEERVGAKDVNPHLTCHELVRERVRTWMLAHPSDCGGLTETGLRRIYAERLEADFERLRHENMTDALQAGRSALIYCVQAEAYGRLAGFASSVITSMSDPRLPQTLLPYLEEAVSSVPEGRERWCCLASLADAWQFCGRPDASLDYYAQAAAAVRAAVEAAGESTPQIWWDLTWITGNWANALRDVGNLDAARRQYLETAEAMKQGGRPAVEVMGTELEALRIDILQGRVQEIRPAVASRLSRLANWWMEHRVGRSVPEAPDAETLARAYISALDVTKDVHDSQRNWQAGLQCLDKILEVQQALHRPATDVAANRMNRAVVLTHLRRFGEAQAELEGCLEVFANDPVRRARTLSALASLFDAQGDVAQAIIQERRSLALREQLPNPRDRAIAHEKLATFLDRDDRAGHFAEAARHRLAALTYRLIAQMWQHLQISLRAFAVHFRRVQAAGAVVTVPLIAELRADPDFRSLDEWLQVRQVGTEALQTSVDELLAVARQVASQAASTEESISP